MSTVDKKWEKVQIVPLDSRNSGEFAKTCKNVKQFQVSFKKHFTILLLRKVEYVLTCEQFRDVLLTEVTSLAAALSAASINKTKMHLHATTAWQLPEVKKFFLALTFDIFNLVYYQIKLNITFSPDPLYYIVQCEFRKSCFLCWSSGELGLYME